MEIALKWNSRSPSADGTRIFKSETPFDESSLPDSPIATVGPGVSTYIDGDVVSGDQYFYRTEVFKGSNKALSAQLTAEAVVRSGPGPQILLDGDLEAGYYGRIPSNEFVNTAVLTTHVGLDVGSKREVTEWHKFSHKGKILFFPAQSLAYGVSWQQLYLLGLVYGVDGPGIPGTGITPTNQMKTITINGETFIIRLMTGLGDLGSFALNSADLIPNGYYYALDTVGCDGSEWNDLTLRAYDLSGLTLTSKPVSLRKTGYFNGASKVYGDYGSTAWSATLVQELNPKNLSQCLYRGLAGSNSYIKMGAAKFAAVGAITDTVYFTANVSCPFNWRPVLEWVP